MLEVKRPLARAGVPGSGTSMRPQGKIRQISCSGIQLITQLCRNSGGNSITGAIRESYGLAHQVLSIAIFGHRKRYHIFVQAGMISTPPKSSSKTRVMREGSKKLVTDPNVILSDCAERV